MKKCKHCTIELPLSEFETERSLKCNRCKRTIALEKEQAKQNKAIDRLKSKKQKEVVVLSLSQLKKVVRKKVHAYIRERDKNLPCISCGKFAKLEAGHYIADGSSSFLRFNLDNIHGQCMSCNRYGHGNLINYRIGLVKKIGEDKVKWLEDNRRKIKKWTREELEEVMNSVLTSANR